MNEHLTYSLWSFNVSNDFLIISANHPMQYGNVVILLINYVILLFKFAIIFVGKQKFKIRLQSRLFYLEKVRINLWLIIN